MEILTGGLAPEYGTRLAGVVNIVTKSAAPNRAARSGTSYGSYNQTNSYATYGGSDASGAFHYLLSVNGFSTDRGLDTPAPADINNDQNGGSQQAIHDQAYGSDEFIKLDWQADNYNNLSWWLSARTSFTRSRTMTVLSTRAVPISTAIS
jgi:outer membrane cobalamin receptor